MVPFRDIGTCKQCMGQHNPINTGSNKIGNQMVLNEYYPEIDKSKMVSQVSQCWSILGCNVIIAILIWNMESFGMMI